jgi:hypothetical protein
MIVKKPNRGRRTQSRVGRPCSAPCSQRFAADAFISWSLSDLECLPVISHSIGLSLKPQNTGWNGVESIVIAVARLAIELGEHSESERCRGGNRGAPGGRRLRLERITEGDELE